MPHSTSKQLQLGKIALEQGDGNQAEQRFRAVLHEPGCPAHMRVEAYIGLGRCLDQRGRRPAAQACYRRVLALTDDLNYRQLARTLYRKS